MSEMSIDKRTSTRSLQFVIGIDKVEGRGAGAKAVWKGKVGSRSFCHPIEVHPDS